MADLDSLRRELERGPSITRLEHMVSEALAEAQRLREENARLRTALTQVEFCATQASLRGDESLATVGVVARAALRGQP